MRKTLRLSILAAVFACAGASASVAADMAVKARPVVPPVAYYNWTGFYIGGHGGGVWGDTNTFLSGSGQPIKVSIDGGFVGVHGGYDWQLPNRFVLGVQVAAPIAVTSKGRTPDPLFPTTVFHEGDARWAVLFTGHVGYALGADGRWLPYVGGGLAVGEGKATFIFPGTRFTDSQTHVGYTVLGGLRYAFANNWWGGVQYNYVDLGAETYVLGAPRSISFQSHSVAGMLSYKF